MLINRAPLLLTVAILSACTGKFFHSTTFHATTNECDKLVSDLYDHFNEGIMFQSLEDGLDVLWKASFHGHVPHKENAGFLVAEGLIILPNRNNTLQSANISTLPIKILDNKLYVQYKGNLSEVYGIIHTHIDPYSAATPTPRNDYQFGYLGLHNYVLSYHTIYDAYKNCKGEEIFTDLGARKDYKPFAFLLRQNANPQIASLNK